MDHVIMHRSDYYISLAHGIDVMFQVFDDVIDDDVTAWYHIILRVFVLSDYFVMDIKGMISS